MSSLTTDSIKYYNEVKKIRTQKFESEWTPVWSYCEMTQLLIYAYSFTFLTKEGLQNRKLIYRKWINSLKNEIQLGIYNLNDIMFQEEEINCSLNDTFEIQEMIKRDINLIEDKGVVLHGYDKQFTDFKLNKQFTWNLDREMNNNLFLLINKIRQLKST